MLKKVGLVKATQRITSSQHFCCTRSEDWVNIICLGSWKQNQQSLVSESYYKVQRVVLTTRSLWLAMVFVCTETLHPGSKDTTMGGFDCWLWRCLIKQIHIIITQIGPLLVRIKFVFLDSNLYWSNKILRWLTGSWRCLKTLIPSAIQWWRQRCLQSRWSCSACQSRWHTGPGRRRPSSSQHRAPSHTAMGCTLWRSASVVPLDHTFA